MPRRVDWDERRTELGEAVWRTIERHGIEHTSIRNIAEESGWTRGVLQLYFRNKDEIMLFAFELAADRSLDIDSRAREGATGLDILRRLMLARARPDEEQAQIVVVLYSLIIRGQTHPGLGEAVRRRWSGWIDITKELFRELDAEGALRPGLDLEQAPIEYLAAVQGMNQLQFIDHAVFAGENGDGVVDEYLRKIGSPAELRRLGIEPPEPALC